MSMATDEPTFEGRDGESSAADSEEEREGEEGEEAPVESLVVGRSKRVTAGNRLSALLAQEADDVDDADADDDLGLLFAEVDEEEDMEFEEGEDEDAADAQLDSSSDEEDPGPAKGNDDLEGERELQRQDRAERKKRKAQETIIRPGPARKKAKFDHTATGAQQTAPTPHARKKSERLNWLPGPDEGPVRSSSRKQTVENKTIIHERMKENEQRRVKLIETMEAAAKRKEASKPKAITQAGRMAEAARIEKKNAKSLNRWEETEKKRAEDQRAKLEALHNRQLSGPVISWWSGIARWVNGRLGQVGVEAVRESEASEGAVTRGSDENIIPDSPTADRSEGIQHQDSVMADMAASVPQPAASDPQRPDHAEKSEQVGFASQQGSLGFLDGIHFYASLPAPPPQPREPPEPKSPPRPTEDIPPTQTTLKPPADVVEYSVRNLVQLENIDANALKLPELQSHILLKKRNCRPPSK